MSDLLSEYKYAIMQGFIISKHARTFSTAYCNRGTTCKSTGQFAMVLK